MGIRKIMLCGIDEAGRGPLAGPLVVAGVVLKKKIDGLADSKKLTSKKRAILFDVIIENSQYAIVFKTNKEIDLIGLTQCMHDALLEIINKVSATTYLLDGNFAFGIQNLETMIKADAHIEAVSAASILAKVARDRFMQDVASQYSKYGFGKNKGYGTKEHIAAIEAFGYSPLHRKSFIVKKFS